MKALLVVLAVLLAIPVVVVGGARLVAANTGPGYGGVDAVPCESRKALLEDFSLVDGLTNDSVRNVFRFAADPSAVPDDLRPAFDTYFGPNPTRESAESLEDWFETC